MKPPPDPHRITFAQWLAVAGIWAAVLYAALNPTPSKDDVRFTQASLACAEPR
jgi:hypothetical protein